MRFITLDENGKIISTRKAKTIVEGEIQSDIGELGQIMQPDGTFIDAPLDLQTLKLNKENEINQLADNEIKQGFHSSALGTQHGYPNDDKFPQWYRDKMAVQNSNARNSTVDWLTDQGMKSHTAEQFDNVFSDLVAFEQPIEYKRLALLMQIKAATSQEELDLIVW